MSADLRDFAAAFNQSYQHASASAIAAADKAQQRAIQVERNRIIDQRNTANARRDDIKLGLYAESVRNAGALAQARAAKLLGGKGGGGGGPAASGGTPDEVDKRLANVGLTLDKPAPPPQVNVNVASSDGGGADASPGAPPESTPVVTERRGGMVPKLASGGVVGDLSLGQAESYESRDKTDSSTPATATSAFTSGLSSGAAAATKGDKDKDSGTSKPSTPQPATRPPTAIVPNVSPDLSGTGETYRRGGAVRRYADGGVASAIPNLETQGPQAIQYAPPPQPVAPQYSGSSGSANAATGSGGDAAGGASGSGGIGGSASAGEGGSAAAGTSGGAADAGDGGGTYRRGGRVRRFQSGGRVMEAIDTGTSGPGSGFGYRAPPPVRR